MRRYEERKKMTGIKFSIVGRRIEGKWELVAVSNGKFYRAFAEKDLYKIISTHIMTLLKSDRPDDTEISVEISIQEPDKKNESTDE
jgi:hypothetical protein